MWVNVCKRHLCFWKSSHDKVCLCCGNWCFVVVCGVSRMQSMAGIWLCGRALAKAGSQKHVFFVVAKCFWGNVEDSGKLTFLEVILCVWFFYPFTVVHVSFFCMLTEFVLVSESSVELAMNVASRNQIDCCYYHNCVSQLVSSVLISELYFSHSWSPSCGLIVTGIIQTLCSLAVQNQIFFPSFCQQKHADAMLGWATWELASTPVCVSKSFMILYSSDHY